MQPRNLAGSGEEFPQTFQSRNRSSIDPAIRLISSQIQSHGGPGVKFDAN